jgi:hypothetical protein
MRSVRVLDVLFTAHSAVNLLSRVAAAQAQKVCQVENIQSGHTAPLAQRKDVNEVDIDIQPDFPKDVERGQPQPSIVSDFNTTDRATSSSRETPLGDAKDTSTPPNVVKGSPLMGATTEEIRRKVKERYSKPASTLYQSLELGSIAQPEQVLVNRLYKLN